MKLAFNEEKKMFKGRINNIEIWTKDIKKATWYENNKRIKGCRMITYDEAKHIMEG